MSVLCVNFDFVYLVVCGGEWDCVGQEVVYDDVLWFEVIVDGVCGVVECDWVGDWVDERCFVMWCSGGGVWIDYYWECGCLQCGFEVGEFCLVQLWIDVVCDQEWVFVDCDVFCVGDLGDGVGWQVEVVGDFFCVDVVGGEIVDGVDFGLIEGWEYVVGVDVDVGLQVIVVLCWCEDLEWLVYQCCCVYYFDLVGWCYVGFCGDCG